MVKGKKGNGKKDTITKQDALDFLRLGCTPKEIADAFGLPWQRVAAIKGVLFKPRRDPDKRASITRSHHR